MKMGGGITDIVCFNHQYIQINNTINLQSHHFNKHSINIQNFKKLYKNSKIKGWTIWNKAFRKEICQNAINKLDLEKHKYKIAEDGFMFYLLVNASLNNVLLLNNHFYKYYENLSSITKKRDYQTFLEQKECYLIMINYIERLNIKDSFTYKFLRQLREDYLNYLKSNFEYFNQTDEYENYLTSLKTTNKKIYNESQIMKYRKLKKSSLKAFLIYSYYRILISLQN